MNKKSKIFLGAGLSSIMLVFVLLCLITFSLLSLSSANADRKLSQKAADRTKGYYEACSEAAKRQQEMDEELKIGFVNGMTEAEYLQMAEAVSKKEGYTMEGDMIAFAVDIGEEEELYVELKVKLPEKEKSDYFETVAWQTRQKGQWKADQTLPVLQKQ